MPLDLRGQIRNPPRLRDFVTVHIPGQGQLVVLFQNVYAEIHDLGVLDKYEGDPPQLVKYSERRYVIRYRQEFLQATQVTDTLALGWIVRKVRLMTEIRQGDYMEIETERSLA